MFSPERDLGVVVSAGDTLFWEEQIRGMIGKAKQMTFGLLGMLYLGNQKCYNTIIQSFCQTPFGIRSAGVGPNRKTRKLRYYNGN